MMAISQYRGACHCGAVVFEAELDIDQTLVCNCSRYQKLGSVLSFASRERFQLLRGKDNLTCYQFSKRQIQHLFCKSCGIQGFSYGSMPDGTPMVAVNVN